MSRSQADLFPAETVGVRNGGMEKVLERVISVDDDLHVIIGDESEEGMRLGGGGGGARGGGGGGAGRQLRKGGG